VETINSTKKVKRKVIKVIKQIKSYFNKKNELEQQIGHLNHQIKLMQDHIVVQKQEILSCNKKINDLEKLLDLAQNVKRY
jgi:chromosome segregation ATPase